MQPLTLSLLPSLLLHKLQFQHTSLVSLLTKISWTSLQFNLAPQITISRGKKLLYATEPVPILWQRGTQSYNLFSQASGAATASTNLFWPATAWGSEETKKQIIPVLSRAQGSIRTGHHLSALSLWTPVNGRSELTGEYFLINCTISSGSTQANTRALVNTGDSGYAFID